MYSTYNEEKSVVAERVIQTSKNKIFKYMAAVSNKVYFDVLDDIVNKYNNTVHRTIKMKQMVLILYTMKILMKKFLKFKAGDRVRISKHKNIVSKGYTQNWSEEVFVVSKIKNAVPCY